MTNPSKGRADYYAPGDWNIQCYECGRKRKASMVVKNWQGYYVCRKDYEPRHPQDFVRGVPERPMPPWVQPPPEDVFVGFCTINGMSAIPGFAIPGCSIPGRTFIDYEAVPDEAPVCDFFTSQGIPGWAMPGCSVPGFDPFAA